MRKKLIPYILSFVLVPSAYLLLPTPVSAVCPICTIAVGAGLGLSRYFGIDDAISGIWIGGLLISITLWTIDWLKKRDWAWVKKLTNLYLHILTFAFYILITFPPLSWSGIIGHPFNTILGIDKLIFGSTLGMIMFVLGVLADKKVRKIKGKQLFPYQKVVFPVTFLAITSLLLYFYGGYLK